MRADLVEGIFADIFAKGVRRGRGSIGRVGMAMAFSTELTALSAALSAGLLFSLLQAASAADRMTGRVRTVQRRWRIIGGPLLEENEPMVGWDATGSKRDCAAGAENAG
jgi:hypothetical protein